jgi:hypothetical protein
MHRNMTCRLAYALFLAFAFLSMAFAPVAQAQQGLDPADPMVRITSGKTSLDVAAVMEAVGRDLGAGAGLGPELVTYYWQTFDAISLAGKPSTDKPLFVDLYVPCFLAQTKIEKVLTVLADSLSKHTSIAKKWIFIHTHFPKENQVYIDGQIMRGCTPPSAGR